MKNLINAMLWVALIGLTFATQNGLARDSAANIGDLDFEGDSLVLPLVAGRMHPTLSVETSEGEQYHFVLDTGASVNVIDSALAEELGYLVVGEMEIGAPGGAKIPAHVVLVPSLQIGDATLTNAEFVTMDVQAFSQGQMYGVVGIGAFDEYLVTFDIGNSNVHVSKASLTEGQPGVMPYDDADGQIEIDMDVAGTVVPSHIDTGSMGEFMLPGELISTLPVQISTSPGRKAKLVGGDRDIQTGKLDGVVKFSGLSFDNPTISFMTPSTGSGNIGSGVIRELLFSIDQQQNLLQFSRPANRKPVDPADAPRRVGLQFRNMQGTDSLTVAAVGPGSLAEKAGLQSGDVLVAVNERATGDYDMSELGAIFRSNDTLMIEVDRDGEAVMVKIE
jgi:predicted aspartyl protease